ncbi:MAG: APC family permease [Pseudomonadota bacterium]|nr:APC family permease [Pseudomonadota bacterium]
MLSKSTKKISLLSLVMITVISVDSIRNLPAAAMFGEVLISFYLLAAVFFLIPTALVSAELAAMFNDSSGGIYSWVKEAFGDRVGVFAIWLQWIQNVIWYPTILSFVAGALGYVIDSNIVNSNLYLAISIILLFLILTYLNLRGIQISATFSNYCSFMGLLLPMILIISLGFNWFISGSKIAISFSLANLVPNLGDGEAWLSLTAIILSVSGVEIATVHARDVDNPQQKFPRALLYSAAIILSTLIMGSLAIAIVIPASEINLITGIIQAFKTFFSAYNLEWVLPYMSLSLAIGAAGTVSNWIIAPTKGLFFAAKDNNLPKLFKIENKAGAPSALLYIQAIVVSLISLIFLFIPNVSQSYWVLTQIATQLYMVMYLLMFISFLKLKKIKTMQNDSFKIPYGKLGMIVTVGFGIFGCLITFVISFVPPGIVYAGDIYTYVVLLLLALIILCLPPFFLFKKN